MYKGIYITCRVFRLARHNFPFLRNEKRNRKFIQGNINETRNKFEKIMSEQGFSLDHSDWPASSIEIFTLTISKVTTLQVPVKWYWNFSWSFILNRELCQIGAWKGIQKQMLFYNFWQSDKYGAKFNIVWPYETRLKPTYTQALDCEIWRKFTRNKHCLLKVYKWLY